MYGESIWSTTKLAALISNAIVLGLITVGAVFVYSLGAMDVSIGKQVGFYATVMILIGNKTGSLLWGILVSLGISFLIALINGAAGDLLHIFPMIASLVVSFILGGGLSISYSRMGKQSITLRGIDCSIFKNPVFMFGVLLTEFLAAYFLFNYTEIGKMAKAIGANPTAAEQCGINLVKHKVVCYVILNICVVTAAVFQMGYVSSASPSTGTGFEMNVMVALILGGMPLAGGMKSKISCALIGVLTYSLLDVGLPMIGVAIEQVYLVKAIIFTVIVLITCRKKKGILPR